MTTFAVIVAAASAGLIVIAIGLTFFSMPHPKGYGFDVDEQRE